MILNSQSFEHASSPKHRPVKRAVLSALPWFFALLFIAGAGLVFVQAPGKVPGEVPALITSRTTEGETVSPPARIKIPAIGVDAPVINLGLNANRTLQVPKGDSEVGWYTGSPSPGGIGPAVMVGHLDSIRGPAVFQNLHQLKPGDVVEVTHVDGSQVEFIVESSQKVPQDNFPTEQVYGKIDHAGLRLITCAGSYSKLRGRYSDNLIVFASLKK